MPNTASDSTPSPGGAQDCNDPSISTRSAKLTATLKDLPSEVITRIVSLAKDAREIQDNFEEDPDDRAGNEVYPFYKSLRLTSKVFERIVTPFLFEVVVLWYHSDSWATLNQIAGSRLASCVKTILLSTLVPLGSYEDKDDWCRATSSMRGLQGLLRTQPPDGGPCSRLNFGKVDECYTRYMYWFQGERVMERHELHDTAPELRLHLLINLNRVQTVDHKGLSSIRVRVDKDNYGHWDARDLTRREVESCVRDDDESAHLLDHSHLRLLATAQEHHGFSITSLAAEHPWQLIGNHGFDRELRMTGLRRLELSLLSPTVGDLAFTLPFQVPNQYPLSSWVLSLDFLEELSVIGGLEARYFDVLRLLAPAFFPKLSKLSLQGAAIARTTLATFLEKHRPTLSYLRIRDPWLVSMVQEQQVWDQARRWIEATAEHYGVVTDLSQELVTIEDVSTHPRYKQYLAF